MARQLTRRQKATDTEYEANEEAFEEGAQEGKGTRRSRATSDSGSEGRRASRRGGDDSEDETPTESTVATGWGGYKKNRDESKRGFNDDFKVEADAEPVLVQFVDDAPYASYQEHWIKELGAGERKTYICLGAKCPLCNELGDEPNRFLVLFNVIDFTDPDSPELKTWKASANPAGAIEERALAKGSSPINKPGLYFAVSKKKNKNGFFSYTIDVVKERDLEEDGWGVEPLTDDEFDALAEKALDKDSVKLDSVADLKKIVRQVL